MPSILLSLLLLFTPDLSADGGNHYGWRNKKPKVSPTPPPVEQVSTPSVPGGGGGNQYRYSAD